MCPVCIASTTAIVAGASLTGGILGVCIGKFRRFYQADRFGLLHLRNKQVTNKGEMKWPHVKTETKTGKGGPR